jgi:hypothetical protein
MALRTWVWPTDPGSNKGAGKSNLTEDQMLKGEVWIVSVDKGTFTDCTIWQDEKEAKRNYENSVRTYRKVTIQHYKEVT